jgi:arsenate reductase
VQLVYGLHDLNNGSETMSESKYSVLFICVGNSARSIFAESILRKSAGDRFDAYSAGTRPGSQLHPFAVQVLNDKGHDISTLYSKDISEFMAPSAPKFNFVFTVCDHAEDEYCAAWEGQPITAHWGTKDPVKADGNDAQKALAFQEAYGALKQRIDLFTSLNKATLSQLDIQKSVHEIDKEI